MLRCSTWPRCTTDHSAFIAGEQLATMYHKLSGIECASLYNIATMAMVYFWPQCIGEQLARIFHGLGGTECASMYNMATNTSGHSALLANSWQEYFIDWVVLSVLQYTTWTRCTSGHNALLANKILVATIYHGLGGIECASVYNMDTTDVLLATMHCWRTRY